MEGNRRIFGHMPDGTPVEEIALRSGDVSCQIITYGGAVRSLSVPGRDGNPVDVVLGFDTLEDYRAQDKYIGALVGRYANRIGGAKFTLDGVEYPLYANDGPNSLHGGKVGFDKQVWTVEALTGNSVTLSLVSPDGQEGYPGTLAVRVTYTLEDGILALSYWAKSDQKTYCNLTNHSYFNLSGHNSGPVTGQTGQYIKLASTHYTPIGGGLIPTGEIAPVEGTPMDLRTAQPIGAHIDDAFEQLAMAGGYDHNWLVAGWDIGAVDKPPLLAATAYSPNTGIAMSVHTTLPGIQFYAGNFLDGEAGKGGAVYGKRCGFCLETQFYPDSPNQPNFPGCVLQAGMEYRSTTSFRFFLLDDAGQL